MSDGFADLPRSAAGGRNPWLIAGVVSIATFMEVLDTTIANVALRHMAGSFGAGQDESTWILTSYLVSNAIILPISGWLANVVGRKRFYMLCVALFTLSSALCAVATSLPFMIAMRIFQGIGGGGLAPSEQSILADSFPPEKRSQVFALYGLTVVLAPAIGPILGGWLTDSYSWRWVFLINVPVGLLSLTLSGLFLHEPEILLRERRALLSSGFSVDYVGFVLVALGFGTLQVVMDRFQQDDGFSSPFIQALAAVSAVSIAYLVLWEIWQKQPMMNVRLLRHRSFAGACVVMFVIGFTLYSTTQLLPQITQAQLGYDATTAGLTLGAGGLATVLLMPVAGAVTGRVVQPKWLIALALIVTGLAMLNLACLPPDAGFTTLSLGRVFQAVALPFLFIPVSAASYVGLPAGSNNEASAIINLMRNIGGSVGVSFATTMVERRTQFHHARLSEHITAATDLAGRTLGQVAQSLQSQASLLSYLDVFLVLGLGALVIWPVAFLLRSLPKGNVQLGH